MARKTQTPKATKQYQTPLEAIAYEIKTKEAEIAFYIGYMQEDKRGKEKVDSLVAQVADLLETVKRDSGREGYTSMRKLSAIQHDVMWAVANMGFDDIASIAERMDEMQANIIASQQKLAELKIKYAEMLISR